MQQLRIVLLMMILTVGVVFAQHVETFGLSGISVETANKALSIAEAQQASLPLGRPPLSVGTNAIDWLEWITNALQLNSRAAQTQLTDALMQAQYVPPDEQDTAVMQWQSDMQQLLRALDAAQQPQNQEDLMAQLENLPLDPAEPASYQEASRLSYLLTLTDVPEQTMETLELVRPRLEALLSSAKEVQ